MNKIFSKSLIQFIRFGLVGVINTFVSYFITNGCYYILSIPMQICNIIAFVLSVIVSFILNSLFVFDNREFRFNAILKTLSKLYIMYSFTGLLLTALLLEIEVNRFDIPLYIASLMNLAITVPINFLLSKFWAFRKNKKRSKEEIEKLSYKHSFVICAYKTSPYLEECIKSLLNQEIKTNIILTTSTPSKYIEELTKKYNIKYYIKNGKSDIQDDWNFAVSKCNTELVTVAHQDDIYDKEYSKYILNSYTGNELMIFTDNYYYIDGKSVDQKNTKIKRLLKTPLRFKLLSKSRFVRKMTLALGNTVQCPAVTYNTKKIKGDIFTSDLKFGLDWDTFLKIYLMKGDITYIPKKLMSFRISNESTTKEDISSSVRYKEDIIMFSKFWPKFIVKMIMKFYVKSYDVYDLQKKV